MKNIIDRLETEYANVPLKNGLTLFVNGESKYFLKRRSSFSDEDAIRSICRYGISDVIDVDEKNILETYVPFDQVSLNLKEFAVLARKIHGTKKNGKSLVHGDLSRYNTTLINNEPLCFDYEHAHWGNPYVDLGRIFLRECKGYEEDSFFIKQYFGNGFNLDDFRKGIIHFCEWQHNIRKEKALRFSEVPLVRKERVQMTSFDLKKMLYEFKRKV